MQTPQNHDALQSALQRFDSVMLVTHNHDGELRSRPMAIAKRDQDGTLWFVTTADAPKIQEILSEPSVNASMQSDTTYVSITGEAKLIQDPDKRDAIWEDGWERWMPRGKDKSDAVLAKLTPKRGEFWDMSNPKQRMRFFYEAGKAMFTDDRIDTSSVMDHATVDYTQSTTQRDGDIPQTRGTGTKPN